MQGFKGLPPHVKPPIDIGLVEVQYTQDWPEERLGHVFHRARNGHKSCVPKLLGRIYQTMSEPALRLLEDNLHRIHSGS